MKIREALSTVALAAVATGCVNGHYVHFNRDALWNTSLAKISYCTYTPVTMKIGLVFCHVDDLTTQVRIDNFTELRVMQVLDDDCYVVKIPYVNDYDPKKRIEMMPVLNQYPSEALAVKPVVVKVLKGSPKYKVGDVFTNWGQYKVRGTANERVPSYYKPVLYLTQINSKNEHVFEEPFIDYGQCSR